jgi:hypothetical protein
MARSGATRSRVVSRLLTVLIAALASLAWAGHALAVDTLTPAVVELTLAPGESAKVDKTLHLDALPGFADIIVAVDTTGSMGGAIAQAKAQAIQLCNDVKAQIPGARFAAVDFEDYPLMPFGSPSDTAYLLLTPGYVADCATFSAAINTMVADGGGDFAEAYNRVFFEAVNDPTLLGSRNALAERFLVVLGDAPPHDATQTQSTACGDRPPTDFGRNNVAGGGDDIETEAAIAGLIADDTTLLMIRYSNFIPLGCYSGLANPTGGTAVNAGADLSGTIIAQIREAAAHIDEVHLEVVGPCSLEISFSPSSYTNVTAPVDLHFTETISVPATLLAGKYTCVVRAVADGTQRGNTEQIDVVVTVGPPATLTLEPKEDVNFVDGKHCVTATVKDALGQPVQGVTVRFEVTRSDGTTITGEVKTNGQGQATFCYDGPALPAKDVIKAYADGNDNDMQDAGEPFDIADKLWIIPPSTKGCEVKITQGIGFTADNGDHATGGGVAKVDAEGNLSGQEEYQDHGPAQPMNLHSIEITSIQCSPDFKSATIFGTATIDGSGTFVFRIDKEDLNEPGKGFDTYHIRVSNGYDSGKHTLEQGNIQIHAA